MYAEAAKRAEAADDDTAVLVLRHGAVSLSAGQQAEDRLAIALATDARDAIARYGPRELITTTPTYPIFCERKRALFSSWYEFFPRSQGAKYDEQKDQWTSGTFDSSHERLEAAAEMGFDVVYLPPIHPIGIAYRKGRNNSLTPSRRSRSPGPSAPRKAGTTRSIPSSARSTTSTASSRSAKRLGLEIALDIAFQCSPDHPWVAAHPEWFCPARRQHRVRRESAEEVSGHLSGELRPRHRPRSAAEMPAESSGSGCRTGVRIFRVDNPHTKPVSFWAWLLGRGYGVRIRT